MFKVLHALQTITTASATHNDAPFIPQLQNALMSEFRQWDLYYAYKWRIVGLSRGPIAEHFSEHAKDEAEHIDILQRYISSMGATPTTQRHPIEDLQNPTIQDIIQLQLKYEKLAVEIYSKLAQDINNEGSPLLAEIQQILAKEQEHAHDLILLLK